ncbi:MAG: hypothetical protein EON93_05785 [Burkholderiales bacterium]|nr:MAG: hypothetical protein EON93_05785 [Burkholderiales bacterium]
MPEPVNDASWADILPSPARVPFLAYKYRHHIHRSWQKVAATFPWSPTEVAVTGRPSTGKSLFVSALDHTNREFDFTPPGVSTGVETAVFNVGPWARIVRTIPGQQSKERADGLNNAIIHNPNLMGVIHVVDWGYTWERVPELRERLVKEDGVDTIQKLRERNLQLEIADYTSILEIVRQTWAKFKRPKWVFVAVNKADLFPEKMTEAQRYYSPLMDSQFTKPLIQLRQNVGADNMRFGAAPVCSWEENFEWNGEIERSRIGGTTASKNLMHEFARRLAQIAE